MLYFGAFFSQKIICINCIQFFCPKKMLFLMCWMNHCIYITWMLVFVWEYIFVGLILHGIQKTYNLLVIKWMCACCSNGSKWHFLRRQLTYVNKKISFHNLNNSRLKIQCGVLPIIKVSFKNQDFYFIFNN
jgi:hypothetical protein